MTRPAREQSLARFRKWQSPFGPAEERAAAEAARDDLSVLVAEKRPLYPGGLAFMRARTAGWLLGWPWLDPIARMLLRRWFFPLSRLWAAARASGGKCESWDSLF
jgi:hypothetical protein